MPTVSIKAWRPRKAGLAVAVAVAMVITGVASAVAQSVGPATPSASGPTHNVIVVLRNQHTDLRIAKGRASSARISAFRSDQTPLLDTARADGARNLHGFNTVNGFSATMTAAQANALAADPSVAAIYPDLPIKGAPETMPQVGTTTSQPPTTDTSSTCPSDPNHPMLEPEALQVTNTAFDDANTPQAQNIVDGTGVKVAFIADGLDINDPDFTRSNGTHVFVDYQDFSGDGLNAPSDGAEAFGDASSIGAQGRVTYDLSDFVNPAHPLPAGCNIRVRGVAPGASLIGLKVFGNSNSAPTSRFIQAIDYAVTDGADVLNESFGGNPFPDTGDDPISLADNAAIAAGVTVVTSTGDAGTAGTVGSPASSGQVIGVGATTTFRAYVQLTDGGAQLSNGTWTNNNISGLSSGGITQAGRTPDLVAPGDLGWALCSTDTALYEGCFNALAEPSPIQEFGGTSQSSPLTAGAAALVIEAYENTHGGAKPTPALVKQFLTSTATDLGTPAYEQGAGLLDSLAAVQAAQSWRDANGSPTRVGTALIVNKNQLTEVADPGTSVSDKLTVTNDSATSQTISATTRTVGKVMQTVSGTDTLNTATAPAYLDGFGFARSFVAQTFAINAADRLDVSMAAASAPFLDRLTLVDPNGVYTAFSIPQGAANFAHVDVRFPMAGTWTAFFAMSQSSGFNGPIAWQAQTSDFKTDGTVSPSSFTLAPGASRTVTVNSQTPSKPGDVSASVQFVSSAGTTSVPLTLRAQVPDGNTTFTGTITGGNGRSAGGVAQSNFYFLNVPKHQDDLGIGITLSDPNELVFANLSGPDGQVYSFASNVSPDETELLNSIQLYRRDPTPGRWVLSIEVTNPVSGLEITQNFKVRVRYDTVNISAPSLPDAAGTKLAAGVPVTVPVKVRNNGVAPLVFFADPRLTTTGTIPLDELSGVSMPIPLPTPDGVTPFWLVPSETTAFTAVATADQPVNMDLFYQSGDPDQYSAAVGNGAAVTVNAPQVSPGIWETDIGQSGPFDGPAPAGSLNVSASAFGQLFDNAVTSSTGDFFAVGVDPAGSPALAEIVANSAKHHLLGGASATAGPDATPTVTTGPLVLDPGQSGTIMVTITPSAAHGTVVKGHLYIDTVDLFTDGGQELIDLPYTYKVN